MQDNKSASAKLKQNKGQQTREQLIEVAFDQFITNGFHGTSMRKIADGAGLALGGIYNHFASKDEILKAVILAYHPLTVIIPEMAAAEGSSGEALMRDAAHRFYQSLQARPDLLNLLFIELIECRGQHLSELMGELMPSALQFGQKVVGSQDVLKSVSPFVLMRAFVGSLIGYILTESILGRVEFGTELEFGTQLEFGTESMGTLDDFLDLMLRGLIKQESK